MLGLIGKKLGMTSIFTENGTSVGCTVIEAGPCSVTQVKTPETDGYSAVQLGFGAVKEKNVNKPLKGHFARASVEPKQTLIEFRDWEKEVQIGDEITLDIFQAGDSVDITGTTKGKGFQGGVKRHGFAGVGGMTHGQHDRQRAPGSIGGASTPSRVFKGMRMAGRTGNNRVKKENLEIVKIIPDKHLILVKGSVPGPKGSTLIIQL
jgi:large subunit ribosomal protein L3